MSSSDPSMASTKSDTSTKPKIKTIDLGVHKVLLAASPWNLRDQWQQVVVALPLFKRLATEIYTLEPFLAVAYVVTQVWSGLESAILLYLSSRLLSIIEIGLKEGKADIPAIMGAVAARTVCTIFAAFIRWQSSRVSPELRSRIKTKFELYLMNANLRIDVPTSREAKSSIRVSSYDAWHAFDGVIDFVTDLIRTFSQMALIVEASRSTGSPLFAMMCVLKPLYMALCDTSLWYIPHVFYMDNEYKKRMNALNNMSAPGFRHEVIGGDLINYVIQEYEKASALLGNVSQDDWPGTLYELQSTPMRDIFTSVLGDLPIIYCAVQALINPTKFSIAQVAILQQSSHMLGWVLQYVVSNVQNFRKQCQDLRNIYEAENISNLLKDGTVSYPRTSEEKSKGMSFELRNLSFNYPGSQTTKNALTNINLSISSGQLVVIVGANGSGKSTILKLLSRIYDPSSPSSLLVDGLPISEYCMSDLHRATATLTQEHHLFPLSLGENIGLGHVQNVHDLDAIRRAADQGGATPCIEKMEKGFETRLDPMNGAYGHRLPSETDHPLAVELERLAKRIELSGGEKQRVVASRTFMRFGTDNVKFVAVDEPSSALDPEGEAQLFDNLIKVREGKTMIFVTHRFGHLTKFADLIVCMKEGSVAEQGTHEELMKMGGEYAKLYNIQASAFNVPEVDVEDDGE